MRPDVNKLRDLAREEIEQILIELPSPLAVRARRLPVTLEERPNSGLQADGIHEDTLGLFAGAEMAEEGHVVLPPHIILFLGNLWEYSERDVGTFLGEVRTTYLHELGHFFGLDEDDLCDRGLE